MGVLDGFEEDTQPPSRGGGGCAIGKWFSQFDEKDRARIRAVLTAPTSERSHPSIATAINARGGRVSIKQVGNHRTGNCQCARVGWV